MWTLACTPKPKPIDFGHDVCAHCKMGIVDKQFAAELVTKKNKVYKFDAIECLVQFPLSRESEDIALYLVRDYTNPDDWMDATQAFYLISPELPSPMGGFLSAYQTRELAQTTQREKNGEILNWEELLSKYAE